MTEHPPNWFEPYARTYFEHHLTPMAGAPNLHFLQIGAFTGDASVWMLENVLTGYGSFLMDVDTWAGSDEPEHHVLDFAEVERIYDRRTATYRPSFLTKYKDTSAAFFAEESKLTFDFIYIDGSHTAFDVLNDAVAAFRVLKVGGLLAFDDYKWRSGRGDPYDPVLAIDSFLNCCANHLRIVDIGPQVWVKRLLP